MHLSNLQAIHLWDELLNAYHGKNGFGTDTAEVYFFRFMPNDPYQVLKSEMIWDEEDVALAKAEIIRLIQKFETMYDVRVLEPYEPPKLVLEGTHRYHLRIYRKES